MIIVRHPGTGGQQQPQQTPQQQQMLVVSAATNSQQQQMQLLQQQQNNIRLASSSLGRGASPATAPSPRQPTPGHFMSPPRNPLHTTLSGTVLSQPPTSNVEQTMTLAQQAQQAGYGLNLDLTALGTTQLVRADSDVTPLTPQDQLSRYVDQL